MASNDPNRKNPKNVPKIKPNVKKEGSGRGSQGKASENDETEINVYSGRHDYFQGGAHKLEKKQGKKHYQNQPHFKSSPSILHDPPTSRSFGHNRMAHNVDMHSNSHSPLVNMNKQHSVKQPHYFKATDRQDNCVRLSQGNNFSQTPNRVHLHAHENPFNSTSHVDFKVVTNFNQQGSSKGGKNLHAAANLKNVGLEHHRKSNPNVFPNSHVMEKMNTGHHLNDHSKHVFKPVPNSSQHFVPSQHYNASKPIPTKPQQHFPSPHYNASKPVPTKPQPFFPSHHYNTAKSVPHPAAVLSNQHPFVTKFVNNAAISSNYGHDITLQNEPQYMQNIEDTKNFKQEPKKKILYQKHSKSPLQPAMRKTRPRPLRRRTKNKSSKLKKETENALPLWSFHRSSETTVEDIKYEEDSDEETNSATMKSHSTDSESSELSDSDVSEISSEMSITSSKANEMVFSYSSSSVTKTGEGFVSTFWDIENCPLPSKTSAIDFVKYIRNTFYEGRTEVDFYVACDVSSLNPSVLRELDEASVIVVHISSLSKNAADKKLLSFLQNFQTEYRNKKSAIVLVSGDSDFASFLNDMRYKHHIFINLICKYDSRHSLFEAAHKSVYFEDLIKQLPERTQKAYIQYTVVVSNLPKNVKSKNIKSDIISKIGNKNCRVNMIDHVRAKIFYPSLAARNKSLPLLENCLIFGNKIEFTISDDLDQDSIKLNKKKIDKVSLNISKKTLHPKDEKPSDSHKEAVNHNAESNICFNTGNNWNKNEKEVLQSAVVAKFTPDSEIKDIKDHNSCHGKAASIVVHVIENFNNMEYWCEKLEKMFGMNDFQLQCLGENALGNMIIKFKSLSQAQKARKLLILVEKCDKSCPKFLKLIKHTADVAGLNIDTGTDVMELNKQKIKECLHFIEMKKEISLKNYEKNVYEAKKGISAQIFGSKEATLEKLSELNEQKITFLNFTSNTKTKVNNLDPLSEAFETSKDLILQDYLRECNCISIGLPVYAKKNMIMKKIRSNQVVIIRAETGSGKSTQLCQYIWREPNLCQNGLIICTQPRKIAAVSLAKYVSSQVGRALGDIVGYEVGMSCKKSSNTAILYTTDFTMLKMMINEGLKNVSCIVIDEAHERTVYTDLLLGMIKKYLSLRHDLKVVVTSATIDISIFCNYFQLTDNSVLEIPGQTFPIDDIWLKSDVHLSWDYFNKTLEIAYEILNDDPGHILAFLTTPLETEKAAETFSNQLMSKACHDNVKVYYLHGKVDIQDQQKVFENLPSGIRKVVFATNCAETSVTIAGIRYVIDCGMVKEVKFDAKKNMNVMSVNFVSQSSSNQRRGRAGRTQAGKCYHLYSKENYDRMDKYSMPEILNTNLGNVLLKIMKMGIKDPLQFDFVQSPPKESLNSAMQQLQNLGAVNYDLSLSEIGFQMASLPLEPRLSHLILKGIEKSAGYEALILSALITVSRNIFFRNNENKNEADIKKLKFCQSESDFITFFNVYKEWVTVPKNSKSKWCVLNCINARSMRTAHDLISELTHIVQKELCLKMSVKLNDTIESNVLLELIFYSFSENLCVYSGHSKFGYKSPNLAGSLMIHPSASLCTFGNCRPDFIVYDSILKTNETYLINISPVSELQILNATSECKINNTLQVLKALKMKSECFSPLGEIVLLRYFIGKGGEKKRNMEKELKQNVRSDQFALDIDVTKGEIRLFTFENNLIEMSQLINCTINEAKEKLMSDEKEVFVIEKCNALSVIIGSGAQVKDIIFPGDFREVKVVLKEDISISDVVGKLQLCGEIIDVREWKNYYKITFSSVSAAKKSVVAFDGEQLFSVQSIVRNNAVNFDSRYYKIFVSLVRRPCTGIAYISFEPQSCYADIVSLLEMFRICYQDQRLCFRVSKKTGDILVSGLPAVVNKDELQKLLASNLPSNISISKLVVVRQKSFENTKLVEESIKQKISDVFSQYTSKDGLTIDLKNTSSSSLFWNAMVIFKNSHEGESAAHIVQKTNFFFQFKPIMEAFIWCRNEVFAVIKEEIDEALNFYTKNSDSKKSLDIKAIPKSNSNVQIQITASNVSDVIDVQKCISNFVLGDQIKCLGNCTLEKLFTKPGLSQLKTIRQENSKCYVHLNNTEKIISLFGSVSACNKVMMEINQFLVKLEGEYSEEINLMSQGHAGILRELLKKYGFDLKKLKEHCDASSIELNSRKYVLYIKGSLESISKCEKIVRNIKESLQNISVLESSGEICGICQLEVSEQKHRLEYCGHAYCKECLLHLFQSSDQFPLNCLVCESLIVLADVTWAIRQEKSLECVIYKKSLEGFILTHDDIKYCPSPNCSMIYRSTKDVENMFNCPLCGNSICTNCNELFHFGMSCSLYQCSKTDNDYSLKVWMSNDPENRKSCPSCSSPIEKNNGCNHMTCWKCKVHMCWLCLAIFPRGDDVYNHQPLCPKLKSVSP